MAKHRSSEESAMVSANFLSWLFLFLLALIWGSSYILIKRGLEGFPPLQVAALRVSITSIALIPLAVRQWKNIQWKNWMPYAVVGFAGNLLPALFFAAAQTKLSSSLAGLLSSLTPLFTLVIGVFFFSFRATWTRILGVLLGLSGAITLVTMGNPPDLPRLTGVLFGLLAIGATICYAISSNVIKAHLQNESSRIILPAAFLMIGLPSLLYLFFTDFPSRVLYMEAALPALGYIAILSLVGTFFASFVFIRLVQLKDAVFASIVSYLVPMIALGWGFLDGEHLSIFHVLGMALILSGVYLTKK